MVKRTDSYPFSRPMIFLTALFLATHFTYFTMAPRILHIFNLFEPGGILVFPFTFLFSDIITEVYTYRYSRFLIWCVIGMLGFFTLSSWVSMQVPAVLDYGYENVFKHYPRLYLGISIGTFFSFFINNAILAKLKLKWEGRLFWIRSLLATSAGHAAFSVIWVFIYHWGEVASKDLFILVSCMYLWKMTFELVATPLAWYISGKLKVVEGIDPYDSKTNFNPFRL